MLVSTLACEWGSRALRINALEVPKDLDPALAAPAAAFRLRGCRPVPDGANPRLQRRHATRGRYEHTQTMGPIRARAQIKDFFIAQRGYWRPWTETMLHACPGFVQHYARYAGYPARTGPLTERMVELIYVALDASPPTFSSLACTPI